ncbi:MAG: B12-binding domain-containing radical SAM protein [Proteobacteria bacterium]|nr:B12-binding domain-containing radical SAM protein [Pseudomonadota bacterium]
MKILFVMYDNEAAQNPIPMGPCYVAAYLRENGIKDISYYSQDVYHYPEEHLTEHITNNNFDVVALGFTAGYFQYKKIGSICNAINKAKNRPFVVLGGHGPTPVPEFYMKLTGADAVVLGEGERPFLNLIKALESKTSLYNVKGIAFKDGNDCIVNEREAPIKNLDTIPHPYYEPLPMEYYVNAKVFQMKRTDRMINMITSRGCNYNCNFCQRIEKGIRFRSVESIMDELKKYIREYHINFVVFWDELFMFSEKRVAELTEGILKENIKINYWCTGRLNIVNREILKMLKKSGCSYIDYGIEQFDNNSLQKMNKKLTEELIIKGIEITKEAGIYIGFNIIFGNIGDTKESLRKSMDFLKKYNDYGQLRVVRPVTPYPGSPLYKTAIKKGLLKGPEDFYNKHKNVELLTVNFTDIPDKEFHELLFKTNKEVIEDYYTHFTDESIKEFYNVYFSEDVSFRGARHI